MVFQSDPTGKNKSSKLTKIPWYLATNGWELETFACLRFLDVGCVKSFLDEGWIGCF